MNKSLGTHLLLDLSSCSYQRINQLEYVYEVLVGACKHTGLTIVDSCVKVFKPQGLSLIFLLEESHISFHSFPQHLAASLDIYTCGDASKLYPLPRILRDKFNAGQMTARFINRGEVTTSQAFPKEYYAPATTDEEIMVSANSAFDDNLADWKFDYSGPDHKEKAE